ncbi:MAG: hypothetical protein AAGD04_11595 [Pseudomonadota bacterium]
MQRFIRSFAAARFDQEGPSRDPVAPAAHQPPDYMQGYDAKTLWYDAIWDAGRITVVLPKPLNFTKLLRQAQITLDDQPTKIQRFRVFRRHALITLPAPSRAKRLEMKGENWRLSSPVHAAEPELFEGLNAGLMISKDNDLQWIEDWARFHIHHHGLEALALIDNGSTRYEPSDILDAMERAGLKAGYVARTELPYGPKAKPGPYRHGSTFLQTAHLNAMRRRVLSKARAVLQCDLDELVWAQGQSIFDLCKANRFGFIRFPGSWRRISTQTERLPRHADHRFSRQGDRTCPHKYCIDPQGPFGKAEFNPHRLEDHWLAATFSSKRAEFWHCASISTNWKTPERSATTGSVPDPIAQKALEEVFGASPDSQPRYE